MKASFLKITAWLLLIISPFSGTYSLPAVYASAPSAPNPNAPSAKDIDAMMEKLRSPDVSYYDKKRIAAVVFVHQDVYRSAVIRGELPAKSPNVDAFLDFKSRLQADVAERMNMHHRNTTGENIKQPIIPFAYNNILSDDDVITGAGKGGKDLEKLYIQSLDELIQERAGQPMTAADRARVDVNGLAWDMTQRGGLENYWHKEKYIQPQSGFANQQKLIEAGDKVRVMGFDENGKLINLEGDAKKNAIMSLTVDKPLDIPGMVDKGTGSMSDYARMAEIHQLKFPGSLSPEEIAQFIRNQKYTDRVVADFNDIALKDNPDLKRELDSFINTSNELRKQTTALGVAQILEKEYGMKIINADGSVNFGKMKEAMQLHQSKQLKVAMPKMIGAVTANEAYKISQWLKTNPGKRAQLRKQLALTYAPFSQERMQTIMADLDKIDIPDEDKAFLKSVLTNDAQQIRDYAKMMNLPTEELVRHLGIEGDNPRAVELLESMDDQVKALSSEMTRRPGGGKMKEFLKSKTAKALNLDVMLDGSKGERVMLFSMMLLAVSRAYGASERNDEGIKKAGMALFEMVPLVASVLRFSEGEFKESFKELAMDIFPPLALAQIAFSILNWGGNLVKDYFTGAVWDGLVNEALKELTDDDFEKTKMKYYRLKNRQSYLEYLEEVEAGFGRVAKLASMTAPEVDALMSRHPEVKANDAALYTCQYFEEFDVIGIRKSLTEKYKIEQIKNWVMQEGGAEKLMSSAKTPVERKAAWLIMDNLRIRAKLYTQVLEGFIDRIEKEYNRRKADEEDVDLNAILEDARLALKQMFENAPEVIKKSEWAFPQLKEEYRRLLDYLKNYKVEGKDKLDLKQEMQALIDDFAQFIKDLERAVALAEEKASLNLNAVVFGGEKSQISTKEVLLADPFRVGITATVQPKRANVGWTVFYYIALASGETKMIGSKSLNAGQFPGGGEGLYVIDETSTATQVMISKAALKPDFETESNYSIYPVIAFGGWSDPIAQVGYNALTDPSEYPELFTPDWVAFAGAPANFIVRRAKVVVKTPPVVYKNDKAKAKMHLDLPEYARQEVTAEGNLKMAGPVEKILSKLDPDKLETISADPEKPTEVLIVMHEKAEEGTYAIELKAKMRGYPDEVQPRPFMKGFDFVNQNNPNLGEDLKKLLEQMQGLEAQAKTLFEAMKTSAEDYLKRIGEASSALAEAKRLAAELQGKIGALEQKVGPLLTNLAQVEKDGQEANRAGTAAAEAHSAAEGAVLKTCETAKSMAGIKDLKQLEVLINQARESNDQYTAQQTLFGKELENARAASLNAESLHQQTVTAVDEIKKEKLDTSPLYEALGKTSEVLSEGEGAANFAEVDAAKLAGIQEAASAALGQAEQILSGISDAAAKTANEEMFKQMQGLYGSIQQYAASSKGFAGQIRGQLVSIKEGLTSTEMAVNDIAEKIEVIQYQTPDQAAMQNAQIAADNAKASYETASAYADAMGELGSNCGICLAEAEKIFGKAEKNQGSSGAEEKDCSSMPGTVRRVRDNGEVYCGCLNGQNWDQTQGRCVGRAASQPQTPPAVDPQTQVAQANCSMYPNTTPQWNAAQGRVQCVCVAGTQWNGSSCAVSPETQVAQANCSMYPGTVAQWNAGLQQVQCVCRQGLQWNGSSCAADAQSQVAQANCSMYPGTTPQWNAAMGQVQCVCAAGTQWNGSSCISNQQQNNPFANLFGNQQPQVDCSMYPGTVAQGTQCVCTQGFQWNGATCVQSGDPLGHLFGNQQVDCSMYPGTVAQGTQCVCPQGSQWNGSSCVSVQQQGHGANPPGSGGGGGDQPPVDLISPIANAAGSGLGGSGQTSNNTNTGTTCPQGTVNIGGTCYTQSSGGPVSGGGMTPPQIQNQPPQQQGGNSGSSCPPGSINLLGVCSAAS